MERVQSSDQRNLASVSTHLTPESPSAQEGRYGLRAYCREQCNPAPMVGTTVIPPSAPEKTFADRAAQEQAKQDIQQLLHQGQLVGLRVRCVDDPLSPGGSESAYQSQPVTPCPVTLLCGGRRIKLCDPDRDLILGLASVEALYSYKRHCDGTDDQSLLPGARWLHGSLASLLANIDEQDNSLDSLYLLRTSGRMGKDGRPISGHDKSTEAMEDIDAEIACIGPNEVITAGYRTEHYRCVLISHPPTLDALYQQLEHKCRLEQELSLPELPLAFYDPTSGSIKDIVFASEFGMTGSGLPELKRHIDTIKQFSHGAECPQLWQVITQLPPARILEFLRKPPMAELQAGIQVRATPYRDQLCKAVEQGDRELVARYHQLGADLRTPYRYMVSLSDHVRSCNLLDVLLEAASEQENLAYKASLGKPTNLDGHVQVGKLLYDHGCRIAVDDTLVRFLPALAAYMMEQGEHYQDVWSLSVFLEQLLSHRVQSMVDDSELQSLAKGVQRHFANQPKELGDGYTEFVGELCGVRGCRRRAPATLSNVYRKGKSSPYCQADQVKLLASAFARCGVVVDTTQLRQHLDTTKGNEQDRLDWKQQSDTAQVRDIFNRVDKPVQADGDQLFSQLTDSKHGLFLFRNVRELAIGERWNPNIPLEQARGIVDCLVADDVVAAQAVVEQLYQSLFGSVGQKAQGVEQVFQWLDTLQNSEQRQRARAETGTRTGSTEPGARVEGKSMDLGTGTDKPVAKASTDMFDWLRALFQVGPDTTGKSYRELAQLAVDHYYRMPHPSQVVRFALDRKPLPTLMKHLHGVEHVTRAQVLAEALLELFVEHDQPLKDVLEHNADLWELIPLAMVYHDATAEVESKEVEATRAAELFVRDMNRVGRYHGQVIEQVAAALRHKQRDVEKNPPFQLAPDSAERSICRILRLADRIDIIRATSISNGWQQPRDRNDISRFNDSLLDLPDQVSDTFDQEFRALLEGAKDLAYVTGGAPYADRSESGSYLDRHNLPANNKYKLRRKVTRAANAYDAVIAALNNNVCRVLANAAGISTCKEDHSKESVQRHGGQLPCLVDKNGRYMLKNIHSELELQQVQVPKQLTVRHKLMLEDLFKQGKVSAHLPSTVVEKLQEEVDRLRAQGIRPPLGTLTQEVLASPPAQAQLDKAYQLEAIQERLWCGDHYQTVFVPYPRSQVGSKTAPSYLETSVTEPPVLDESSDEPVVPVAKRAKLTMTQGR